MSDGLDLSSISKPPLDGDRMMSRQAIFESHLDWAGGIARKVSRKLPPSFDIEDLKQIAYIELWRRTGQFDPTGVHHGVPFQGFAYLAVRGAVLMSVRRKNWKAATGHELKDTHVDPQPLPDRAAERAPSIEAEDQRLDWRLQWLQSATADLPPEQRAVVVGIYFEAADPGDLASRLGVDAQEVMRRRRAAVKQLKKLCPSEPIFAAAPRRRQQPHTPVHSPLRPPLTSPRVARTAT